MKKLEIKGIGTISALKAVTYITIIPAALLFLIGLAMLLIGIAVGEPGLWGIGLAYTIMPVFIVGMYGVISMVIALLYGVLAKKFGGLELIVEEKNEFVFNGPSGNGYQQGAPAPINPPGSPYDAENQIQLTKTSPPPLPNQFRNTNQD